jgi:hypothetical protein
VAGPLSSPAPGLGVVAPTAAPWVTDFLNAAAYARRDPGAHDVRLALGVLTTRWALTGRRVGVRDLPAFHHAFGADRLRGHGVLDHEALLRGAGRLLGEWFPGAWQDGRRRAHGAAFPTVRARRAFDVDERMEVAAVGELTPPVRAVEDREWSTYEPVALPDPDAALALLRDPARWPDMASTAGRFSPLRRGGLRGQTFEIELLASPLPRAPLVVRCYVTCTALHLRGRPLWAAIDALPVPVLPQDAEPLAFIALTTHAGHVLGRAISHLVVWRDARGAWVRDVGCWDPLPPHLAVAYLAGGRAAQHAFWSPEPAEASMLAQLARVTAQAPG